MGIFKIIWHFFGHLVKQAKISLVLGILEIIFLKPKASKQQINSFSLFFFSQGVKFPDPSFQSWINESNELTHLSYSVTVST